ncbi:MAG TPA: hypothetical protein PLK52_04165 [Usitatibacteraceae bacterium]|nr:hypothetical protein [Usitatibacteraceae bacterium]HQY46377.1 hypothetical protein [Usitatibacteraceae bacterium]HRA22727.1 hypothetical protein [Usitatibacteraceae bacterium]
MDRLPRLTALAFLLACLAMAGCQQYAAAAPVPAAGECRSSP